MVAGQISNCCFTGEALYKLIHNNDPEYAKRIILMSVHPQYITDSPELKVYSKYDELLNGSFRVKIESNLICGKRP